MKLIQCAPAQHESRLYRDAFAIFERATGELALRKNVVVSAEWFPLIARQAMQAFSFEELGAVVREEPEACMKAQRGISHGLDLLAATQLACALSRLQGIEVTDMRQMMVWAEQNFGEPRNDIHSWPDIETLAAEQHERLVKGGNRG